MELIELLGYMLALLLLVYLAGVYLSIIRKPAANRLKAYEGRLIDFMALIATLILAIAGRPLADGIYVSYATIGGLAIGIARRHRLGVMAFAIGLGSLLRPVGPIISVRYTPIAKILSAYALSYITARVAANLAYFGQPNRPKLEGITLVYLLAPTVMALVNTHVAALAAMIIGILADRRVIV